MIIAFVWLNVIIMALTWIGIITQGNKDFDHNPHY